MADLYFLPKLRALIEDDAPNILLERSHDNSDQIHEKLRKGETDFIISENRTLDEAVDINWHKLTEVPYITLSSVKNKLSDKKLTLKTIQNTPHIISGQSGGQNTELEDVLLKKGIKQELIHKVSSSLSGILMALDNRDIGDSFRASRQSIIKACQGFCNHFALQITNDGSPSRMAQKL